MADPRGLGHGWVVSQLGFREPESEGMPSFGWLKPGGTTEASQGTGRYTLALVLYPCAGSIPVSKSFSFRTLGEAGFVS